ncbi:MAG TPA: hypothetical protein VFU81_03420 [Thermomicrobiales bacterium]|nr:hypothetical protein [Thermomicrobiales bacterium]
MHGKIAADLAAKAKSPIENLAPARVAAELEAALCRGERHAADRDGTEPVPRAGAPITQ